MNYITKDGKGNIIAYAMEPILVGDYYVVDQGDEDDRLIIYDAESEPIKTLSNINFVPFCIKLDDLWALKEKRDHELMEEIDLKSKINDLEANMRVTVTFSMTLTIALLGVIAFGV